MERRYSSHPPVPPSTPLKLIQPTALCLPRFDDMQNLQTIKFASSTKGKKSRSFYDVCRVSNYDDFTELFHHGYLDRFFDEMVRARAERIWKGQSPENPRGVRWELELIGESCPTINRGFLVSQAFTGTSCDFQSCCFLARYRAQVEEPFTSSITNTFPPHRQPISHSHPSKTSP